MKKKYKRNQRRFVLKSDKSAQLSFDYMGIKMNPVLKDISYDGIGFVIDKDRFSIIDYEVIYLKLSTPEDEFCVPSRVLYSDEIGFSRMKRRYGLHFLTGSKKNIHTFINKNCELQKRSER